MPFRTFAESKVIEDQRLADIAKLSSEIAHLDPDPLMPAERYYGGDGFEGCYSGMVVAATDTHVALWSRRAGRVAILPISGLPSAPAPGTVCCARAWYRSLRAIVAITPEYDWLDAWDDFACALQGMGRSLTFVEHGLRSDMFVLNEHGRVRGEYRDIHAMNMRQPQTYDAAVRDIDLDDLVRVLPGGEVRRAENGTVTSITNRRFYVELNGPRIVCVPREQIRLLEIAAAAD
jgi:hypothetical protein